MKPVLIIRTGHAPDTIRARHGDFPLWFQRAARLARARVRVIDVAAGDSLPPPAETAGAIITGSGAMVTARLRWSEQTAGWIRDAMDVDLPLFGVCFGHQLLAHALGGRVDTHEQSVLEIPSESVTLARSTRDPNQIVRYGSNAISTQFHPEFSAEVMRAYVRRKHADTHRSDLQQLAVFREVAATPVARRLLRQFARRHGWAGAA